MTVLYAKFVQSIITFPAEKTEESKIKELPSRNNTTLTGMGILLS